MKWFLIALALLAVAALVWVLRRPGNRPGGRPSGPRPSRPGARPKPPRSTTARPSAPARPGTIDGTVVAGAPRPGEIWWADVPYDDGSGSKVRPCVVLRPYPGGFEVLKITSQDQSDRSDHVEIPTRTWDPGADHNSYLDLSDPIRVSAAAFDDRAGTLDAKVWKQVRTLHGL